MIAEIGHLALVMALVVAAWQTLVPLYGATRGAQLLMLSGSVAAVVQLLLIGLAFAALTHAYVTNDFSLANVAQNSHSAKPILYQFSGVWGNHEGSMLLWVLILALFGASVAGFGQHLPQTLKARVIAVQGAIGFAFLLFIVAASNPFLRLDSPPTNGNGLNPILQDPALAFHPPFLYAGYVGLSVTFSFAVAALLEGKVDAAWARWVRPWTLLSWAFLTIGIAMGSWWAYYELGWGGFWFWDPVENASFMPWLIATALLHSAVVVEKRDALKVWTILLAIIAFSLSLVGTFLVRSGVLTSVHAFAVDPERGLFILAILGVFIGGSLTLFAWRAPQLKTGTLFAPVSREGGLVLNNILLCAACAGVFVGTLYPLLFETLTGEKMSVGAPYFNIVFGIIMLPLLLLVPVGPLLTWKRADGRKALRILFSSGVAAVTVAGVAWLFIQRGPWLAPCALALGAWMVFGAIRELALRVGWPHISISSALSRLHGLPRSMIATTMAHAGVGLLLMAVVILSVWKIEKIATVQVGGAVDVAVFTITLINVADTKGPNYDGIAATFRIARDQAEVATVVSEKRIFQPKGIPTTEVGLAQRLGGDVYVVLGDRAPDGSFAVRASYNPLASWIWIAAVVMFMGGCLSLTDRRLRIGVPKRAAASVMMQGAE